MGLFDFLKTEEQKRDEVAREIACRTGVLERCPVCRALFDRGHDERLPAADALAHELFERNDPLIAVFQGDRDDLLQRLRSAREPLPYACTCEDAG
ncbi:hypothetical protein [endosymbiont of unidentified scaly snail isolate Monju]|uniref:hypothetical protein n=1 Tax=endosymbiont of unidentified scaly snail isolate Monju TaxID=1248727 RepID=UPI0005BDBB0F|nr:hypothetical protein [endosymbiont of unidentified scaly snail isolate Monju]